MPRTINAAAVAGAAVILVLAVWFDTSVMADAERQAAAAFDPSGLLRLSVVGSVAVVAGCLAVARLGSRAAPIVGLGYAVVGAFIALLPWLVAVFATQVNDTPPVAPEPIAQALGEVAFRTRGPMNAVGLVGAAMLIAGLAGIVRPLWSRRGRSETRFPSAGGDL